MYSGMVSSFFRTFIVLMTVLFVVQVNESATAGTTDFDIPISELNTVKKKNSVKRATGESKKKKRSGKHTHVSTSGTATSNKPISQTKEKTVESDGVAKNEEAPQKSPVADNQLSTSEDIRIYHTPYSFVVTGKRTVIHAVVNSKSDIQEVSCSLITTEGGAQTLVKMVKVDGTRFTYMAALPELSPGSPSLRYTIVAVVTPGKETRSQEYVSPVVSSPVVPSWQLESDAADLVKPAAEKTPLKTISGE